MILTMNKVCEGCNTTFFYPKGSNHPGRFCSRKCFFDSMRTIPETTCLTCGKTVRKRKYCSPSCYWISLEGKTPTKAFIKGQTPWNKGLSGVQSDEKHPGWKGDKVGYVALHQWVVRKLGRSPTCEQCGFTSTNSRKVQWSNISREYKRDLTDWRRLCQSCHGKYDRKMKALES